MFKIIYICNKFWTMHFSGVDRGLVQEVQQVLHSVLDILMNWKEMMENGWLTLIITWHSRFFLLAMIN